MQAYTKEFNYICAFDRDEQREKNEVIVKHD